jgi:cellulose synthase/poly-beta-1,6-N-acetylglucosamine synthase-like glycosyltransferase
MGNIRTQDALHHLYYVIFGLGTLFILIYYLSRTIIYFTTPQQFPVNSFIRFPLTILIFPAEIFSLLFALYFVYVLIADSNRNPRPERMAGRENARVAVLLPIYNEPEEIVARTIKSVEGMRWKGGIRIYLLDDSKDDAYKKSMNRIAEVHDCEYITVKDSRLIRKHGRACSLIRRDERTGFKAGNINNAIKNYVEEDFFVILDSDQAPLPGFLEETMDHFSDEHVGFVQTPQHFVNGATPLERAEKIGMNIFYHAQSASKSFDGAMPFCGTNVVVRKKAFEAVNGFSYYTATEDIDLGIRMNAAGYFGVYVPEVLAVGYAPGSFTSYSSQQYRWANGNLAILRRNWANILFSGKFSLRYQIHTLFTLGWWYIGIVTFIYALVPLLSLYTGLGTHHTWLPGFVLIYLYINVIMGLGMIFMSLHGRLDDEPVRLSDTLLEYSLVANSMFIYMKAALNAMMGKYIGFVRTSKEISFSGLESISLNLGFSILCFVSSVFALYNAAVSSTANQLREYLPVSVWLLFYSVIFASSIMFIGKPAPSISGIEVESDSPVRHKKSYPAGTG